MMEVPKLAPHQTNRAADIAFFLFVAAALAIAYGAALAKPLPSDAVMLTSANSQIKAADGWWRFFLTDFFAGKEYGEIAGTTSGYYRPLANLGFWLEYRLFGARGVYYNLDQLLLHLANAMLVLALGRRLFPASRLAPFIAALLFALHPVNVLPATRADARGDALFLLFYLLAFLAYHRSLFAEAKEGRRWLAAACLLFLLSLLSKEMAATLPLALGCLHLWLYREQGLPLKTARATLWLWGVLGAYLAWRFGILGIPANHVGYTDVYPPLALYLNLPKSFVIYFMRVFLPLGADYDELLPRLVNRIDPSLAEGFLWESIVLLVAAAAATALLYRRYPRLSFLLAFAAAAMAPLLKVNSISTGNDLGILATPERFMYLPAVPLLLLAALGMERAAEFLPAGPARRVLLPAGAAALTLFLAAGAHRHAYALESLPAQLARYRLFDEAALTRNELMRKKTLQAMLIDLERNNLIAARENLEAAMALDPTSPLPAMGLGLLHLRTGEWANPRDAVAPWIDIPRGEMRSRFYRNPAALADFITNIHIPLLVYGQGEAHLGRGKEAARRLCQALARRDQAEAVIEQAQVNWVLNGTPRCIDAKDQAACGKAAMEGGRVPAYSADPAFCGAWVEDIADDE